MKESLVAHTVLGLRSITESVYVLRVSWERGQILPGQRVCIGMPGGQVRRWYSLYGQPQPDQAEFLIRNVSGEGLSRQLQQCQPGDILELGAPTGHFVIDPAEIDNTTFLFIASGTGIAPFHSFVQAYPDLNYILLHGVRYLNERYDMQDYMPERYISCVSRQPGGDFHGRVTDYIEQLDVPPTHKVYLCGNQQMIYDVYYHLISRDHPEDAFASEVYF